jgi:3-methyladenine DNA glycosylase AlkD
MALAEIRKRLRRLGSKDTQKTLQWFFKTGAGGYGEGDVFLGIKAPPLRKLAVEFENAPLKTIRALMSSGIHEERALALMILVRRFSAADEKTRERIYRFYMSQIRFVNNWDLVDSSAPHIIGSYLCTRSRSPLYALARSASVWERRIAILSTFHFIRKNDFDDALKISKLLLTDEHDLIHKAVGWMLREIGKRKATAEKAFLQTHCRQMPRTMLRYAIERFPERERRKYLLTARSR